MDTITDWDKAGLRALAKDAPIAASILHAAYRNAVSAFVPLKTICGVAGIAQARSSEVFRVLRYCEELELFQSAGLDWRFCGARENAEGLAKLLDGIAFFQRELHEDRDVVSVVLSGPTKPSKLAERIEASLRGTLGISQTTGRFFEMADAAKSRLVVMTPFMDEAGAAFVCGLFAHSAAVTKQLIVRRERDGALPHCIGGITSALRSARVSVFDYRLERSEGSGNETFHAKVVLADNACYVGSFNMNRWSLDHSLELGLAARGATAERIGEILDSIVEVSEPVVLCNE